MAKLPKTHKLDEPLRHESHKRPVTRRDFLAQGMAAGLGSVMVPSWLSFLLNPRSAHASATLSTDIENLKNGLCGLANQGAGKIPFICFDLAGGAGMSSSNVLVGQRGGQLDFLTTAGYERMGLPGDMIPPAANAASETNDFINSDLGLSFHSDSGFLRGILASTTPETLLNTNGAVIPVRSENDTGNNPHNPMYAINKVGADGSLLTLIGSRNSDSGGNSVAPPEYFDPTIRPTKIDRPSDVRGLVDTGELVNLLSQQDAVSVLESMVRLSEAKLGNVDTKLTNDTNIKNDVHCNYVKSADLIARFGDPTTLDPDIDTDIVGTNGIFTQEEYDGDGEFRKTASVMKLVMNGYAGAGTVTMGGYDYHTGNRSTGETRDLRAGRCMGACLEYAARLNKPLMLYVFTDGGISSSGMIDNSINGRGKLAWVSDNSSTGSSFFLVYNPGGRPQLIGATPELQAMQQQIGYYRADGSVETASSPAANNVNLLVQTIALNYMALHGEQGNFANIFPAHGLGNSAILDSLTAFEPIVNGTIDNPV